MPSRATTAGPRWRRRSILAVAAIAVAMLAAEASVTPAHAIFPVPPPPPSLTAGQDVELRQFGGQTPNTFMARVVAPGIAVYQGALGDGRDAYTGFLPSGPTPSNPDFLRRVELLIAEIRQHAPGQVVLDALARLRPLATSTSGRWGPPTATWNDVSGNPTSINVVIGLTRTPLGPAYTDFVEPHYADGIGSASAIVLDPAFPATWAWAYEHVPFVEDPVTSLFHELVHAMRNVMGASDPTVVEEGRLHRDGAGGLRRLRSSYRREELRVVGNPEAVIWNPNYAASEAPWQQLPADDRLTASVTTVRDQQELYRSQGLTASAQALDTVRAARETVVHAYSDPLTGPTEWAFALSRQQLPRSHFSVEQLPLTNFTITGTPDEWIDRQRRLTSRHQQFPQDYPGILRVVMRDGDVPLCGASSWQSCSSPAKPMFDSFQLVLQDTTNGQECLNWDDLASASPWVITNNAALYANTCESPGYQFNTGVPHNQTVMYNEISKQLIINPTAAAASTLCLTAASGYARSSLLKPEKCADGDNRQKWEYTTLGQWRLAVDPNNGGYRCMTSLVRYVNYWEELILGDCANPARSRWNVRHPDVRLHEFKLVSPITGYTLTPLITESKLQAASDKEYQVLRWDRQGTGARLASAEYENQACLWMNHATSAEWWNSTSLGRCSDGAPAFRLGKLTNGLITFTGTQITPNGFNAPYSTEGCLYSDPTNPSSGKTWVHCENQSAEQKAATERWRVVPIWAVAQTLNNPTRDWY